MSAPFDSDCHLKALARIERELACGSFSRIAAFYEAFPKDHVGFLVAVRTAFLGAVGTHDAVLFDAIRADLEAFPRRNDSPFAAAGVRIMQNWIRNYLGCTAGKPDYMADFPLSEFPPNWRYATSLLVMKMLYRSGEHLAAWSVSELLLNLHGNQELDAAADIHIKLTRLLICQELGRMEDADLWARQTVEAVRTNDVVLPLLGNLIGPKSPLERNLLERAPELHAKAKALQNRFFAGILKFHNRLTGDACAEDLTPREFYLARALTHGLTYKEVAFRMGIAYCRVNELVTTLHEKLGIRSSAAMRSLIW